MPDDYRELITKGYLLPDPKDPHSMKCAQCRLPVILVWNHGPEAEPEADTRAGVWGEDVTVICLCCSYSHCPHKGGRPADSKEETDI